MLEEKFTKQSLLILGSFKGNNTAFRVQPGKHVQLTSVYKQQNVPCGHWWCELGFAVLLPYYAFPLPTGVCCGLCSFETCASRITWCQWASATGFSACLPAMSNEVETSTTNGQPDQQAAPKVPSKKEKKKGMGKWLVWLSRELTLKF